MKRTSVVAVSVATLLLALAGCSAPEAEPVPTASPTAEAESTATTLKELSDIYNDAGGLCENPQRRASSVAEDAADCENGAVLSVYSSEAQRDSAIAVLQGLQETNPAPYVIAVGVDWTINAADAGSRAEAMGAEAVQIGDSAAAVGAVGQDLDLSTDAGLCEADAALTNLELNDAIAPTLGYSADRDLRTSEQDDAIRAFKNAAFERECPERAG